MPRLAQGVQATIVQEIGHPATLFPMVEAGIGISVLPALALPCRREVACGKRLPGVERQLMLVRRKNRSLSGAAQACGKWCVCRPTINGGPHTRSTV
jgi:DNA-binding transcriptional LysR family regulator